MADSINDTKSEVSELIKGFEKLRESIAGTLEQIEESDMASKFADATKEAKELFDDGMFSSWGRGLSRAKRDIILFAKEIKNTRTSVLALGGAIGGLGIGFTMAKLALMGFGGILKSVFVGGRAIVGAFTRTIGAFFGFFYDILKESGGGGQLFEVLQEMRKEFGGLEDYTNQAIFSIADNLRQLPRRLKDVGITLADVLKNALEYAKILGPLFMKFVREDFTPATVLFVKGMGMSDDAFRAFVQSARSNGQRVNQVMERVARIGSAIGQAIGVSAKIIQREMSEARMNIELFGSVSDEQLGLVIGRYQSLGLEASKAAEITKKFDTFEDAANTVSRLTTAFGVQLDTFRLVNEENPAERLDYLRQQMFRVGKSAEQLSRRQLMLLGDSLGVTDYNMLELALSSKNAGMSMADIEASANASGKATRTLEEVLSDLANQMERMRGSGGGYNTFLEAMNYGIHRGIRLFMWQTGILHGYRASLRATARGFRHLTRDFLNGFPGIYEVAMGFREIFHPQRFREFFREVRGDLREFLAGGSTDIRGFITRLKDRIFEFFDRDGQGLGRVLSGLKTFLITMKEILREGLEFISEKIFSDPQNGLAARFLRGIRTAMEILVAFLRPGNIEAQLRAVGGMGRGFFSGIIGPIIDFFKSPATQAVIRQIIDLIKEAFMRAASYINEAFRHVSGLMFDNMFTGFLVDADGKGPGIARTLMILIFGPAILGSIILPAVTKFAGWIVSSIWKEVATSATTSTGTSMFARAGAAISGAFGRLFSGVSTQAPTPTIGAMNGPTPAPTVSTGAANAVNGAVPTATGLTAMSRFSGSILGRGLQNIGVIAAGGLVIIGLVKLLNWIELNEGILEKIAAVGAMTLATVPMAIALKTMGAMNLAAMGIGIAGLVVVSAGIWAIARVVKAVDSMNISAGTLKNVFGMVGLTAAIGLLAGGLVLLGGIVGNPVGLTAITVGMLAISLVLSQVINVFKDIVSALKDSLGQMTRTEFERVSSGSVIMQSVVSTVADMLRAIGSILSSGASLFVSEEKLITIRNLTNDVIDKTFHGENSIFNKIVNTFRNISESELLLVERGANILQVVVGSAVEIMNSIGTILDGARRTWRGRLDSIFNGLSSVLNTLFSGDSSAINTLIEKTKELSGSDVNGLNAAATVIPAIIGSVGSVLGAVGEVLPAFRRNSQRSILGIKFGNNEGGDENIARVLGVITSIITTLSPMIESTITAIKSSISGLNLSQQQLDVVNAIMPIFDFTSSIISSFIEALPSLDNIPRRAGRSREWQESITVAGNYLSQMKDAFVQIIESGVQTSVTSIVSAVSGIEFSEGQARAVESAATLLGVIGQVITPLVQAFSSGGSNRLEGLRILAESDARNALRDGAEILSTIQETAPDLNAVATSISAIFRDIKEPLREIISTVVSQTNTIEDAAAFGEKSQAILNVVEAVSKVFEISSNLRESANAAGAGGDARTTTALIGESINGVLYAMDMLNDQRFNNLSPVIARLENINQNLMPNLTGFFERSKDLVAAITDSGVINLPVQTIDRLGTILPAAVEALKAEGASLVGNNIRVAMNGLTFNITVNLSVDGKELGRVAAENISNNTQ